MGWLDRLLGREKKDEMAGSSDLSREDMQQQAESAVEGPATQTEDMAQAGRERAGDEIDRETT
jgi:hypothetical protein